ncbi:MAG: hypothetical protein QM535_21990, partial [Limnohabitans sp.]|nr:hypothetical protein [Limnohabitans sp.]
MNSFYVFLPSNVKDPFNKNTISNYVTNLSSTLRLDGDWEVALSEISFKKTWFNIEKGYIVGLVDLKENRTVKNDFTPGYYSAKTLVQEINNSIVALSKESFIKAKNNKLPEFEYNEKRKKSFMKTFLKQNNLFPMISGELLKILGFDEISKFSEAYENDPYGTSEKYLSEKLDKEYISERGFDISQRHDNLYAYCDIVKPSFIGDTQAQILRI